MLSRRLSERMAVQYKQMSPLVGVTTRGLFDFFGKISIKSIDFFGEVCYNGGELDNKNRNLTNK